MTKNEILGVQWERWWSGEVSDSEIIAELISALIEVQQSIKLRETKAAEQRFAKL
jgi:hypothetical protein